MRLGPKFVAATLALALSTSFVVACERNEPEQPQKPKLVLEAVPADARALDIDFEGKLKLIGYKVNTRGPMKPGRNISATLYWKAPQKLEPGFRLSSRLVDGSGETVANLDDASPLRAQKDGRALHGPETWTPGKVYVDELSFRVPREVKSTKVQVLAGVAKGEQRLRVSGPSADPTSAVVITGPTGVRPSLRLTPPPTLRVDRLDAATKIQLDGKLDEAAWQAAPASTFVDTASGKPNPNFPLNGTFRILWNKEGFYIGADLKDPDIVGGFKPEDKDPHVWTKDAMMMMIDPDGDGDNVDYYEIQIGPQNLVYDTRYDTLNEPHKDPNGPFGHEEWTAAVKSAVTVKGTIDDHGDRDEGYVVEAFVPWKSFDKAKKVPPAIGDVWRINVYAMRDGRGVGWSPILGRGTLHNAARFGRVLWAEKGYTEPAAGNAASPAESAATPLAASAASAPQTAPKKAPPATPQPVPAKTPPGAP